MIKTRRYICFFAVSLLALFLVAGFNRNSFSTELKMYFDVPSKDSSQRIHSVRNKDGNYYVFLPEYSDMAGVSVASDAKFRINNEPVNKGDLLGKFEADVPYDISYSVMGMNCTNKITFVKIGSLPVMHIDTRSGSLDFINEDKNNEETADVCVFDTEGSELFADDNAQINVRGNSTREQYDKKPYSLKLSENADLFGMGSAQRWILLANASDPTYMRNKLVYDFAKGFGYEYSPDSAWVNVYFNGTYYGLYQLCERNEIHPERIDIPEDTGVLVSMESEDRMKAQNYQYVATAKGQALRIHHPKIAGSEKTDSIQKKMQSVENALVSENYRDSVSNKSLTELIDGESWIKKYLAEEVFGNLDGGYISQYFYWDGTEEGKVYAGPLWDFDFALGSDAVWQTGFSDAFFANRLQVREGVEAPWFYYLYNNKDFYDSITSLYRDSFLPALAKVVSSDVSGYKMLIEDSARADILRWDLSEDGFDTGVDALCEYMNKRMKFLEDIWFGNTEYHSVIFNDDSYTNYAYTMVAHGQRVSHLPETYESEDFEFTGWYREDTDELFDVTQPVEKDMVIYAGWKSKASFDFGKLTLLVPFGVLALLGILLLLTDIRRQRGSR